MRSIARPIPAILIAVSIFSTYCATAPRQSALTVRFEDVAKNIEEIRAVLYRNAARFTTTIEESADKIKERTLDSQIQRNTLLWKMYGIPAVHQAAFHPDPVAGFLDMKTLLVQMCDFFATGEGKNAFGEWQNIALSDLEAYQRDFDDVMSSMTKSGDITTLQEYVHSWADEHTIEDFYFQRISFAVLLDSLAYNEKRGLFDATGIIADGVNDLSGRMNIYAEYLPRQARWQAEYLLLAEGAQLSNSLVDSLQFQLNAMLDSINMQRIATLEELQRERIALTDFVHTERIAFTQELNTLMDKLLDPVNELVGRIPGVGILVGIILIGIPLALGIIIGRITHRKG